MISDEELHKAWDRIARTADGYTIYLHLQKRLMGVVGACDDSTLRQSEGERMFAAKLIGLMAKGIEESAPGLATSAITFSRTGPVAVSRSRGAGRRIGPEHRVAGWDAAESEPSAGT